VNSNLVAVFETVFNVVYLLVVWGLVILMACRYQKVEAGNKAVARLVMIAFILLASGDTGHVGFRVVAHVMNALDKQVMVFGSPMNLTGLGMMTTAYTVTIFYMVLVYAWMKRFNRNASWFTYLLLAMGIARLIFMALPANNWGNPVPPLAISVWRNSFLWVQGVGIVWLLLSSAYKMNDRTFKWIGWSIVASFAFYTPVILLAPQYPLLGMLMIPKTCAYLVVAIIAYKALWQPSKTGK
jgi:hypothetical protein